MQLKKYLLNKLPAYAVVLFVLGLTSCGSYQYVGQDSDGIYSEDEVQEDVVQADTEANSVYYKNYFKEKSLEMDSNGNDEVFVDIDSYEGSYSEDYVEAANVGYGAWGENTSEVSVNIYNSGFNNYWNRPYYGWNSFGWNRPYSGWNFGYGYGDFGYGDFYSPYWHSPYNFGYGYGYGGYPYYSGYYGRNGYGRNGVVYSSRRRGSTYGRSSALGRRVEASRRSNTTSTRTRTSSTPRVRTSTPRTRSSNSTPRVRTTTPRTSTPRVRTTTPRTRTSTPRTSTPRVRTTTPRTRTSTPKASSPSRSSTRSSSGSSSRSSSGSRRRG